MTRRVNTDMAALVCPVLQAVPPRYCRFIGVDLLVGRVLSLFFRGSIGAELQLLGEIVAGVGLRSHRTDKPSRYP